MEVGSEAHLQGLRTGDQILRVGGGGGISGPPAGTPYRRPDTQGIVIIKCAVLSVLYSVQMYIYRPEISPNRGCVILVIFTPFNERRQHLKLYNYTT
jgi:hypothetical protein